MSVNDDELQTDLRQALVHLDDPPHLESLGLARRLRRNDQDASLSRGQALRRTLRLAIASLDPGVEATQSPIRARAYQVLYRYAIARQSMVSIGMSLGISGRQAYRELDTALDALWLVIAPMLECEPRVAPIAPNSQEQALQDQFAWLAQEPVAEIDLSDLIEQVLTTIKPLARRHGVALDPVVIESGLLARARRLVLRQATMNLLSHAVSITSNGRVGVFLRPDGPDACLCIRYGIEQEGDAMAPNSPYAVAIRLLDSSAVRWQRVRKPENTIDFKQFISGPRQARVIIIDDNASLINLYSRYLSLHPYDVQGATNLEQALALAQQAPPDLVLLDIMMPGQDGWEILQAIRSTPGGRQAKVIICSVINDPELASALGTDAFLNKPLDQATLVQTVARVLTSPK